MFASNNNTRVACSSEASTASSSSSRARGDDDIVDDIALLSSPSPPRGGKKAMPSSMGGVAVFSSLKQYYRLSAVAAAATLPFSQEEEEPNDPSSCHFVNLPPCLEEVTTTTCSDDATSVTSSLSGDEELNEATAAVPRSIFNKYWQHKGGAPCIRRNRQQCTSSRRPLATAAPAALPLQVNGNADPLSLSRGSSQGKNGFYEHSLKITEEDCKNTISSTNELLLSPQRSIFGKPCYTRSCPSLLRKQAETRSESCHRSFSSTPSMHRDRRNQSSSLKKTRSCLRLSRYAGNDAPSTKTAAALHVKISPHVDVLEFEIPTEVWAPAGWSDWYSYAA